ncbi:MAG: hypothetical protein SFV52_15095 [Saprospiraceae bacterium]|nr:hypothetical protein [Saprospiraceae bacterium]
MKTSLAIAFLSFFSLYLFGQTPPFTPPDLPAIVYKFDTVTTHHSDFNIYLITAQDKRSLNTDEYTKIWFYQTTSDNQIIEKYLGETDAEHGFYIPSMQPLTQYFVLVECGEMNGTVNLIDLHGKWISIPGYYFAVDSAHNAIVTLPSGDGLFTVAKVDLMTKEIETKQTNGNENTWLGINAYYHVTEDDWIKAPRSNK